MDIKKIIIKNKKEEKKTSVPNLLWNITSIRNMYRCASRHNSNKLSLTKGHLRIIEFRMREKRKEIAHSKPLPKSASSDRPARRCKQFRQLWARRLPWCRPIETYREVSVRYRYYRPGISSTTGVRRYGMWREAGGVRVSGAGSKPRCCNYCVMTDGPPSCLRSRHLRRGAESWSFCPGG